jgi:hypothetical protein
MSHLQTLIRAAKVRGRVCPKCQALMLLCDITPIGLAAELHKFSCVDCDHVFPPCALAITIAKALAESDSTTHERSCYPLTT